MRFRLGSIPHSEDFTPDDSWTPLREPSPAAAQAISVPVGLAAGGLLAGLWWLLTPVQNVLSHASLPAILLALVGIVVVHELVHAAVHPQAGLSPRSILGLWPSKGLFYAHYDGEMSRERFVALLLMPLLVISVLPLLIAIPLRMPVAWSPALSCVNALCASVDMLGAAIVLWQVPPRARVRNQGWFTYWAQPQPPAA